LGAGVTENGDLVFVAVDGSSSHFSGQAAAAGATLRDLALLMQDLGCKEALHLDGGGSTQVFGQAGGALIASADLHHGLMSRGARYDRPIPTWLRLDL
jgi:exopolysaccharide biosynthesis protein